MAFDPLSLILASAIGATAPAAQPVPALEGLALSYDRIGAPTTGAAAPVALALARHCGESIWKMSGIQLVTCMIAHPDDVFSPSDE